MIYVDVDVYKIEMTNILIMALFESIPILRNKWNWNPLKAMGYILRQF